MIFFTPYCVSGTKRKSNFFLCEAPNSVIPSDLNDLINFDDKNDNNEC